MCTVPLNRCVFYSIHTATTHMTHMTNNIMVLVTSSSFPDTPDAHLHNCSSVQILRPSGETCHIPCNEDTRGRYLIVRLVEEQVLGLCEVQVYGQLGIYSIKAKLG